MMIRTRELMMLIIFLIAAGDDWSKPGLDVVDGLDEKLHQLKPIKSSSHSATDHRGAGGGDWSKPGLGVVDGLQPITNSSHSVTKTTGEKKKIYIAEVDKNCGNMHINLTRSGETQKVTFTIDNTTIEDLNFNYGITVQFSGTCIMVSPLIKLIEDFDFVWLPSSDTVNIEFEQSVELFWSYKTQRSPTRIILKRKSDIKKERVGIWTLANGFQTELNISTIFSKTVIYNSNITDGFIYETVGLKLSEVNLEDIRVVYYCRVIYGMEYRYTKYVTLIHAESTTINVYDEVIPEKKSLIILLVSMESAICILLVVFLIVTIILFFCIKYTGCKSKKQACQNQMIPSAYSKYHVTIEKESVPFCKKLCWLGHYKMTQDEYHNYDEELL
ncbi:uncharacterized protein LOC126826167 isoform X5 [Patella vulgata]|uniref:uncharacterized protein LOC126826167 isoform X5 n=1 Tax=Patella vulgata TaxID=6465 RepID=UPI0024A7E6F4|nr:uncharacterized protein LOC126826167 isoform X5 [Patella vulgata]